MVDDKFSPLMLDALLENGESSPTSLTELETLVEQLNNKIGRQMLQKWLQDCEETDPAPSTRCSGCGQAANFISKRVGFVHTKFGLVRYLRAYYVCPQCHQSTCPLDERMHPYESLARLRRQIAVGKSLPVDELANAWGLGSLKGFSQEDANSGQNRTPGTYQVDPASPKTFPIRTSDHSIPMVQEPMLAES